MGEKICPEGASLLFLDAIERIEVALRVDLAHTLGKRDPWAHRSVGLLDAKRANAPFQGSTRHQSWLIKADHSVTRSREDWVVEFGTKYSSPLPIWMAVEAWDPHSEHWHEGTGSEPRGQRLAIAGSGQNDDRRRAGVAARYELCDDAPTPRASVGRPGRQCLLV
nr:Abi family protein [Gluconacetobacter azotocaptans]